MRILMVKACIRHLLDVIIPYWGKIIDNKYGGYYGYVDFNLNVDVLADKGVILNSRILWFFSKASISLKDEALIPYATQAYNFMQNYCIDKKNGGLYHMVGYDGSERNTDKYTYNQSFAIYALCAYYEAVGESNILNQAIEIFECIESKAADECGYEESFSMQWEPILNEELSENGLIASKTMNTLLHLVEAYTELYRLSLDERVKCSLVRLLEIFCEKVYNPKLNRLEVFFDDEMNSIADLHSYGHDIEATWLLDRAAAVIGDDTLIQRTVVYTNRIAENILRNIAIPTENTLCIPNEQFNGVRDNTRVWWVQAEAVVGLANKFQQNGDRAYADGAESIWQYILDKLWDKRDDGEWFWSVDKNDNPIQSKPITEPWKCPYHNGRMCMELIERNIEF